MNRWWVIGGIVVLVGVLLVGAWWTSGMRPGAPKGSSSEKPVQAGTASPQGTTPESGGSGAAPPKPVTAPTTKLGEVKTPPAETVAMVDSTQATPGSRYAIVFVPYGSGPGGPKVSLVVRISSSDPVGSVKKRFALAGKNALLDVRGLPPGDYPSTGGSYTGTVVLQQEGSVLVPRLVSAKRK